MGQKININRDDLSVTMERTFDVPREILWRLNTDPELIPKWWGPRETKAIIEKLDARDGGEWKIISENPDGSRDVFYGKYLDVKEPEHITWEFNYEPVGPGHEVVETLRFEDAGEGKTKISTFSKYKSLEDLDGMAQSGWEEGATETWDRLEELAKELM